MLASRWDESAHFPLQSCVVKVWVLDDSEWNVTEEHETNLRLWRERGYKVELGISEGTREEEYV